MKLSTSNITMALAVAAYREGNLRGSGFAPYTDSPLPGMSGVLTSAIADGWTIVLPCWTNAEVEVLVNGDGKLMAIGDANGPWAVIISDLEVAR